EQLFAFGDQPGRGGRHPGGEPAVKMKAAVPPAQRALLPPQRCAPPLLVGLPERGRAAAEFLPAADDLRVVLGLPESGQLDLRTDELRPGRVRGATLLLQPVGIDQPRRIVLRMVEDRLEQARLVGHATALPWRTITRPRRGSKLGRSAGWRRLAHT